MTQNNRAYYDIMPQDCVGELPCRDHSAVSDITSIVPQKNTGKKPQKPHNTFGVPIIYNCKIRGLLYVSPTSIILLFNSQISVICKTGSIWIQNVPSTKLDSQMQTNGSNLWQSYKHPQAVMATLTWDDDCCCIKHWNTMQQLRLQTWSCNEFFYRKQSI